MVKIDKLRKKYQPTESKVLKPIFHKHCNKRNWKRPFSATVNTKKEADKLAEAVRWFHASEPKITRIATTVQHKQGLVSMPGKPRYKIISKGYQAY